MSSRSSGELQPQAADDMKEPARAAPREMPAAP